MSPEIKFTVGITMAVMVVVAVVLFIAEAAYGRDISDEGRWVDFGPWNGVVDCEASPTPGTPHLVPRHHKAKYSAEVRADSRGHTPDLGIVQFIQPTWNSVSSLRHAWWLVGRDPRTVTLAEQLRNGQWLRVNRGIRHWSCGYRYGDGTGPRWVTAVWKESPHPFRCARNLRRHHGFKWKHAASICGYA